MTLRPTRIQVTILEEYRPYHSLDGWYFWDSAGTQHLFPGKSRNEVRAIADKMKREHESNEP